MGNQTSGQVPSPPPVIETILLPSSSVVTTSYLTQIGSGSFTIQPWRIFSTNYWEISESKLYPICYQGTDGKSTCISDPGKYIFSIDKLDVNWGVGFCKTLRQEIRVFLINLDDGVIVKQLYNKSDSFAACSRYETFTIEQNYKCPFTIDKAGRYGIVAVEMGSSNVGGGTTGGTESDVGFKMDFTIYKVTLDPLA